MYIYIHRLYLNYCFRKEKQDGVRVKLLNSRFDNIEFYFKYKDFKGIIFIILKLSLKLVLLNVFI